ncbi:hypothetical protein [Protaetiibacter mangrovi]|uniref:SAF domain-containing protein n=1 Tax=Protaetiibacter mangrovi TaxID=2970926 RepID=A0ABT1ZHQ5_9MICO|nr:hypothetical protein [Protaetiibacter mangrovi]MCS0500244.1 hypothetical protein [Protaetiibacter mangrovi]TPX03610.1 hypothetical protein FJ656_16260 [Schumannella luteola]
MVALTATPRRRAAIDIRLLIGLALVVASVAGVVALVGAVDARTPVYAAAGALSPGDRVDDTDLVVRSVSLDGADGLYLRVGELPDGGLVVVQPVRDGELLPLAALGETAGVRSTALVIELGTSPSSAVQAGATVDVWASPADADGRGYGAPIVLVADAIIVRVVVDDGLVSSSGGGAVEVLVPRSRVARVLQAQAAGDALAVVPAGLALGR